MNSIQRVVLALGLISLGSIGQVTWACSTSGCCTTSSSCNTDCGDCQCYGGYFTSKSFFSDRISPFASATYLRDALFRINAADEREDGFGGALQVVPFGGRTTDHGSKELARWFGYNHKGVCGCPIAFVNNIIDNGAGILANDGDIFADHFNISVKNQTFKSTITFSPRQKFFGVGLDWKQVLFFNDDCTRRWWFEVAAPIVHIENDMRMCETIVDDGGGLLEGSGINDQPNVATMAEAFAQAGMKYGKILTCKTGTSCCTTTSNTACSTCCSSDNCDAMKETRIADIELKLGYNQSLTACASLDTYLGLVLPTGNKAKGEYVFEAIVGNGQHWGVMLGGELGFDLYHHDSGDLKWFAAADLRYLFHNKQVRSFDLVGKPWSRYMTVFASQEKAQLAADDTNAIKYADFGINYLTRCVKVHPRCEFNFDTSFAWDGEHFLAEVGYGLYARQAERIDPNWTEGPVLRDMLTTDADVINIVASMSNLARSSNIGMGVYDEAKIKTCDIDWNTAAHPGVLSNTVYASLGYKWGDVCYPTMLSVGGGWDFAFSNTAMHKWTLFGKLGVSF